ncbi:MAG: MBL fold metallo-hydrolase [Kiritimatiellae bacterium]|nr:MBL fold metallo-hydrolase [Kiritimatiellia bacterium]
MKIAFLGTGTSIGVPAIGCDCAVCLSADPFNKRRRASLYIEAAGRQVVIDTPPDFREQALAFGLKRLDAVFYTHAHVDHILGFDDIRRFNQVQKEIIPVYGSAATLADISRIFPYIHFPEKPGLSYPRVSLNAVEKPFKIGGLRVIPVPVRHADIPTYGYRLEAEGRAFGYVPDCQELDEQAFAGLRELDILILDTLRRRPHPTHFSLSESVAVLQKLRPVQAYLTHIGHDLDHRQTSAELPAGIALAYDGLVVNL